MNNILQRYADHYYNGEPVISDEIYDYLEDTYGRGDVGHEGGDVTHYRQMYSLDKVYVGDKLKLQEYDLIHSPKLDGCAISLLYDKGILVQAATRGDGKRGINILEKVLKIGSIPYTIDRKGKHQITGEIVCPYGTDNARNFASGAMNIKDMDKFALRVGSLAFVAYNISDSDNVDYVEDMGELVRYGFTTVLGYDLEDMYRTDGYVYRVSSNLDFAKLGYTSRHPRGAFALKDRADVAIEEAELLRVEWQVGSSGKITPVAYFTEVVIDDAKITKATLHNVGFVEDLNLDIGDTIMVTRAGGVIPKIIGVKKC